MTVDELQVLITANTTELRKEINKANKNISSLQKSATKGTKGVTTAFSKLKTGIVALGIGKVIADSIQSGMDAIESDSLFETVMGDNADAVRSWSNDVSDALGLSAVNMQKNIGVIYNMTSSMGVAEDNALKLSKGVSVLAEDMASFYNLDSDEAFNKLRAGLTGETEPLKALGILVDENTIKQYAYSEGIAETGAELTNEQKVLARYVAILKQTGNAQGDLARTLNSPSNQLRQLKQQVTNFGIALSNFLMPVISAVLPYLTAFAKVATQAVNSLANFFGFTSSSTSDETQTIATNVDSVSSGLDDATTSAKKLKRTLAGFDEMNVLQDNSSDSTGTSTDGSGGTATVGLDFDLSEYDARLDLVNSKTNALVEKIKGEFESIGEGIDFKNLTDSFKKLKKSLEPITSTIFDGLKWGYNNVLKPLAQWTIGEAIPAFFDAVSGALDFLNPIIERFKEYGVWLWDNFLSPIAEWTGGVIVDTLEGLGTVLSDLGAWLGENQWAIDTAVATLTTFFGLWAIGKIADFITSSGGLVKAFNSITKAVQASTLAKNLDSVSTGIASTAQTIWNGISAVGTAVTTALGAAFNFLCSPIGLVVLAIAAVIAIVVLCIKYWDEIKAVAIKVWDGIKAVWSVVADWIKTKVVDPIKNFFSGLWDGIKNIFSSVGTWFKDKFTSAWTSIKNAFSKVGSFFSGIWTTIKDTFSKVGSTIGDAVSGAFKSAINWVLEKAVGLINGFISGINTAIGIINKIPGVEIKKISKLDVPELARGGVIDRPTLAVVGEAGKEAVMPLERNTGWIDQLSDKIGSKLNGASGNINLIVKLGEEAIFDRFIEYGKKKAFETNGEVVFV